MMLCLDCGNSRLKWGVCDGSRWLGQGALAHAEISQLAGICREYAPQRTMLANVAGAQVEAAIVEALGEASAGLQVVRASAAAAGVVNLYERPEQLGVDRWCALLGARALGASARLVVMAGTAMTVDSLDASGRFIGGMILPGLGMMLRALSDGTAALPMASGRYVVAPRSTDDAIMTGCIEAQLAVIERAFARLSGAGAVCLLSGGDARRLAQYLVIPHQLAENLPLEGLRQLALVS